MKALVPAGAPGISNRLSASTTAGSRRSWAARQLAQVAQNGHVLSVFLVVLAVEELHGAANLHGGLLALGGIFQGHRLGNQGFDGRP